MRFQDFIGHELALGDLVAVELPHVVGQIVALESGEIARGVVVDGKPQGQVFPHITIKIELSTVAAPDPNGTIVSVLKLHKPEQTIKMISEGN